MTMGELADASGVSPGHLSKVENGRSGLGLKTLHQLAQGLRMPPLCLVIFPDEDERDRLTELLRKLPPDKLREFRRKIRPRKQRSQ